jgi:predicted transposase/invertase (TIGR01784 family)
MGMALAPLNNSVVFKKIFTDPAVVTAFIYDLTGLEVDIRPENIQTEKRFKPPIGPVDIALDIFIEDPVHRLIIEIQRVRYDYHYDRFLYYHQAATVELASSHRGYKLDRTVHTIVWLTAKTDDKRYQHDLLTTSLRTVTRAGDTVPLFPHKLYFLNPNYLSAETPSGLADWLKLVTESINNPRQPALNYEREVIRRASELAEDNLTPEEMAVLFQETGYEKNLQLHEEKGLKQGLQLGLEQGRQEGRQEGGREKALEIARSMLAQGLDPALVTALTGFTPTDLEGVSSGSSANS